MLAHGDYIKVRFCTDEDLDDIRRAACSLGMKDASKYNPSSWAGLFHDPFPLPPRPRFTDTLYFPAHISGAWEECREVGIVEGVQEYDMISAYGWSGLREIPAFQTAWPTDKYDGAGLYLVYLHSAGVGLIPPHLRAAITQRKAVWVSDEEIERLDLRFAVIRGLKFARYWKSGDRIKRIIDAAPERVWKKILRSYWGVYLAPQGTTCEALKSKKVWTLPNRLYDPISAHYIISRVRNRVADYAPRAAHIFTDAVITREAIPCGTILGDWRIKNNYKLVKVKHAGRYDFVNSAGQIGARGVG